mmetsp:Transcript_31651/g.46518  ORF Transcript_31651/g.46518 Transcript_31651/m.46518 type:complete len:774 (-) Transcript_31651:1113-3434(-)
MTDEKKSGSREEERKSPVSIMITKDDILVDEEKEFSTTTTSPNLKTPISIRRSPHQCENDSQNVVDHHELINQKDSSSMTNSPVAVVNNKTNQSLDDDNLTFPDNNFKKETTDKDFFSSNNQDAFEDMENTHNISVAISSPYAKTSPVPISSKTSTPANKIMLLDDSEFQDKMILNTPVDNNNYLEEDQVKTSTRKNYSLLTTSPMKFRTLNTPNTSVTKSNNIAFVEEEEEEEGEQCTTHQIPAQEQWVKVEHNKKIRIFFLPPVTHNIALSTLELADILTAAFDIKATDKIVGLKIKSKKEEQVKDDKLCGNNFVNGQGHQVMLPLSFVVSGGITQIKSNNTSLRQFFPSSMSQNQSDFLDSDELVFQLVLKESTALHFDNRFGQTHTAKSQSAADNSTTSSESATNDTLFEDDPQEDMSVHSSEESVKALNDGTVLNAFYFIRCLYVMVKHKKINQADVDILTSYIMKNEVNGNISGTLACAFLVAEWKQDTDYFGRTLKKIAKCISNAPLSQDQTRSGAKFEVAISSMDVMLEIAEILFETHQLSAEQYIALMKAILDGADEIKLAFESYRSSLIQFFHGEENVDRRHEVYDSNDNCQREDANLLDDLSHDLLQIGQKLDPIQAAEVFGIQTENSSNCSAASSDWGGSDDDIAEEKSMNNEQMYRTYESVGDKKQKSNKSSDGRINLKYSAGMIPKDFMNAVVCLAQTDHISDDGAVAVLVSYALCNGILRGVYDEFLSSGNTSLLLSMVRFIVYVFIISRLYLGISSE